jgi:DNA-binding XRE family transcriptional regulator
MYDIMESKHISWRELVELTHLTRMTLYNASKGKGVTLTTAQAIAKALSEPIENIWPTENNEEAA